MSSKRRVDILNEIFYFITPCYMETSVENQSVKITFAKNTVPFCLFWFTSRSTKPADTVGIRITRFIFARQFRFFLLCGTQISGSRFLDSLHSHSLKHGVSWRVHVILNASACRKYRIVTLLANIYRN